MMSVKQDNVFVTGATGFVGSYIVRSLLDEGYVNITCISRSGEGSPMTEDIHDRVRWIQGDILDLPLLWEVMKKQDIVIHAAAMVTFSTKNKKKLLETAIQGTANLVNVALEYAVKKFVHISSIAAIGRRKKNETITEKQIFSHSAFDTTYGMSKFLSEQEVWRGHAEGLPTTILNPSFVLGAGHWEKSSPGILLKVFKGTPTYPTGTNGIVDVRDVSKAAVLAIHSDYDGERFIISAENWSYRDLLMTIAGHLSVKPPKYALTPWLGGFAWRVFALSEWIKGQSPVFTRETVKSMAVKSFYNNTKSKEILGLNYRNPLNTISETCQVFMNTYPKGKPYGIF